MVVEVLQHLVHQQLAFFVRVAGVDDFRRLGDQFAHHDQLVGGALDRLVLHRSDLQRQVFSLPFGILGVVCLWRGQFQQVTNAPGHHITATVDVTRLPHTAAQGFGYHGAQRRFFCNEQSHLLAPKPPKTHTQPSPQRAYGSL
ncbi:hypothetical protein D9M68_863670 [compost metagenome]